MVHFFCFVFRPNVLLTNLQAVPFRLVGKYVFKKCPLAIGGGAFSKNWMAIILAKFAEKSTRTLNLFLDHFPSTLLILRQNFCLTAPAQPILPIVGIVSPQAQAFKAIHRIEESQKSA
eukprot:EG_transcript_27893